MAAPGSPAQAYSPDLDSRNYFELTSYCPCSGGVLSDPFDGTYFAKDSGGTAVKIELVKSGWFVGKVEFHPKAEKLWIYDTRNDGDTIHVGVGWYVGGRFRTRNVSPPSTSSVVDKRVIDMDIPDGVQVEVWVYDDKSLTDVITHRDGRA